MAPRGVDTVVRASIDAAAGAVLSFGLAGAPSELLGDTAHRLVPVTDRDAAELIRSIRAAPVLFGWRGAAPVDTAALEELLLRLSRLVDDHPEVVSVALEPVVVAPQGLTALGAAVRLAPPPARNDLGPPPPSELLSTDRRWPPGRPRQSPARRRMVHMAKTGTTTQGLRAAIERSGYYPALVAEAVEAAVGGEPVASYLVHQETTFDSNEVRRHVTVLVLTENRFIVSHTDEQAADTSSPTPYATTSTESVKLERISSVVVSRVVANPEKYVPGTLPREVVLTIGWGAVSRIDLEPAACGDSNCEADHGYTGSSTADDLSLRVSEVKRRPRHRAPDPRLRAVALRGHGRHRGDRPLMAQPAWQDPVPLALDTAPVPEYGSGSLADLLPTLVAGQEVPGFTAAIPELAPADRNCVFLIDGLGWEQIKAHPDEAPFLHSLLPTSRGGTGRPITAGFPSTTATSLASVGTGLPPGEHGLPGYTVRDPGTGVLMNQLRWKPWTEPKVWQPHPTVFQLADAAGVRTAQVSAPMFEQTPLTKVALSGGSFLGSPARSAWTSPPSGSPRATARSSTRTTARSTARATVSAWTPTPGGAS